MNLVLLIILLPFIGFLLAAFSNKKFYNCIYNLIGVLPIFFCFLITNYLYIYYFYDQNIFFSKKLWTWTIINNFPINFGVYVDKLSLTMLEVITGVGFLIQFFSVWYMKKKNDLSRFFSYTNLFLSSMLLLILSDNLLLTYFSWELVGFCSYALIGFYYDNLLNVKYSMKAFIVTRIGDLFMLVGIFLIFLLFKTLNFSELNHDFYFINFLSNQKIFLLISILILLGAISKSAQFPLQIWLSKAMVGPTPVSALIHSSTMITAGVYLIIRMNYLFSTSNIILNLISFLGCCTILIASFSAIFESDIKKILAYSTMSQIGYMFLGLGMKLWNAVISHLVIHSFFKALLFLSSGALIIFCNNEKNILKMGGLKKSLPFLYFCFLIGTLSLTAFPILTSSFYTKGSIIFGILSKKNYIFFFISVLGSFLTALYSFRMLFLIFFNDCKLQLKFFNRNIYYFFPLLTLSIFSSLIGVILFRPTLDISIFSNFIHLNKILFESFLFFVSFLGIKIAHYFYILKNKRFKQDSHEKFFYLFHFINNNFGLDYFYKFFFVNFFILLKKIFSIDYIKKFTNIFNILLVFSNNFLAVFETGYLHFYILSIFLGTLFILLYLLI
jgi:NADH-quinone oxidoreductase subunit L